MTWLGFACGGMSGAKDILALVGPATLWAGMDLFAVPITEEYMKKDRGE